MPLHIDEVAIRTEEGGGDAAANPQRTEPRDATRIIDASDREAIVEECVRRVLRALSEREGR